MKFLIIALANVPSSVMRTKVNVDLIIVENTFLYPFLLIPIRRL